MARPWLARFWVQLGVAGCALLGWVGLLLSQRGEESAASPASLRGAIPELGQRLKEKGLRREASDLEAQCRAASETEACARDAVRAALDLDQPARALALLEALGSGVSGVDGARAEALARDGKMSDAEQVREKMGARAHSDPFATYAAAHMAYLKDQRAEATEQAERAAALGRGAPAHVLLTLLAFQSGDWARARRASEAALALEPDSVDALYNRAVLDQREGRYHSAREGLLGVLRRAPRHTDARYNLTLLTSDAGAEAEAHHHLEKLRGLLGEEDPRVQALARRVDSGPEAARASARAASARAEGQGP